MYAQKLIGETQGDENKLYNPFIQKLAERRTRPTIVEYQKVLKMPREKYYLYREDGMENTRVIKYKDNVNEVYSLTEAYLNDEKKIMTDSDLKRFKGARGLLHE